MEVASLGLLVYEKNIIEDYIAQYHASLSEQRIEWLPANADSLKVVIIRASFLGSSEVNKYLHKLPSDVVVLSVCKKKDDYIHAVNHKIDVIDISENNPQKIQAWVNKIPAKRTTQSLSNNPLIIEPSGKFNALTSAEAVKDLFALFSGLTAIVYLRTKQAQLVWIDCLATKAYLNTEKILIPAIENYEWQVLPHDFDIRKQCNIDALHNISLNEWIWEAIWESKLDLSCLISENTAYKLLRWPHFCQYSKMGRTESLRLSARIKKNPLSYKELLSDSVYNEFVVSKFIYSMLTINFIQAVPISHEAALLNAIKMDTFEKPLVDQNENKSVKRNFLSRMRKFIGL